MPNGTRRGHHYVRNGKTFYRGASRIKLPASTFAVGVGVGAGLLVFGAPQAVVAVVGIGVIGGFFLFRNRKALRTMRGAGRRIQRRAQIRAKAKGRPTTSERLQRRWADLNKPTSHVPPARRT